MAASFYIDKRPERIVVLGDTHGDFGLLMLLLKDCAKVVDQKGRWRNGNKTYVVLVGDTVDRKRPGVPSGGEVPGEELFMHLYLNYLQRESRAHGGRVLKLLGNHEEMNMMGDYTFATKMGKELRKVVPLKPGSPFARILYSPQDTYAFVQLGPYFFVHGGLGGMSANDILRLTKANPAVKNWFRNGLRGGRRGATTIDVVSRMLWDRDYTTARHCNAGHLQQVFDAIGRLHGGDTPSMVLSGHSVTVHNSAPDSRAFTEVLREDDNTTVLGLSKMINGSRRGMGINLSCDGRVARLDNGASRAMGHDTSRGRLPQVLVIENMRHMHVVRHKRGLLHQTSRCLAPGIDVSSLAQILRDELGRS